MLTYAVVGRSQRRVSWLDMRGNDGVVSDGSDGREMSEILRCWPHETAQHHACGNDEPMCSTHGPQAKQRRFASQDTFGRWY